MSVQSEDLADLAVSSDECPDAAPLSVTEIWRSVLPTARELRLARRRLHAKAFVIVGLLVVSYYLLVISSYGVLVRLGAAAALVIAVVALATGVMHDANHGAFSRHRFVNRVLAYTSDALGASSSLWRFQHNVLHHGNTNVDGFDADLSLSPWGRLAPSQTWRRRFQWQHIYIWPLYGFLAIKNLLVSDLMSLTNGRVGSQPLRRKPDARTVLGVTVGKLAHLAWAIVIPLMFNPWWGVLAFYAAASWFVGFTLAMIFQLAHCVDAAEMVEADQPRRGQDFVAHQLRTTVNIASPVPVVGHMFRWLAGGLDHQIEHHLAPGLPHTIYPRLAARFRVACEAHGVRYRQHTGIWSAVRSHARWLHTMGRPVVSAP